MCFGDLLSGLSLYLEVDFLFDEADEVAEFIVLVAFIGSVEEAVHVEVAEQVNEDVVLCELLDKFVLRVLDVVVECVAGDVPYFLFGDGVDDDIVGLAHIYVFRLQRYELFGTVLSIWSFISDFLRVACVFVCVFLHGYKK